MRKPDTYQPYNQIIKSRTLQINCLIGFIVLDDSKETPKSTPNQREGDGKFVRLVHHKRRLQKSQRSLTAIKHKHRPAPFVFNPVQTESCEDNSHDDSNYESSVISSIPRGETSSKTSNPVNVWMEKFKQAASLNKELAEANEQLRNDISLNPRGSSTAFPDNDQSQQLLQLLSDTLLNRQVPITATALGPCMPHDGGEVQITDWECWKRRFEAWLKASNITDPLDKQTYFDVYAGDKLAIALMTAPEISDSLEDGYDLTVRKLDAVFKSRSSSFALKKDFRSMAQQKSETNVAYLSRLMKAVLRIWERTDPLIDSEIMLTMAVNSSNTKMQEFALQISSDGSSVRNKYEDLVNQARLVDSMAELKVSTESRVLTHEFENRERTSTVRVLASAAD